MRFAHAIASIQESGVQETGYLRVLEESKVRVGGRKQVGLE